MSDREELWQRELSHIGEKDGRHIRAIAAHLDHPWTDFTPDDIWAAFKLGLTFREQPE